MSVDTIFIKTAQLKYQQNMAQTTPSTFRVGLILIFLDYYYQGKPIKLYNITYLIHKW